MNPNDLSAVIKGIAPALKEFIHDGLAPCEARLGGVERRLDALSTVGEKGVDGANGRDGVDGKDGPAGPEGPQGKDGAPGRDGIDGAKGIDGAQGQPGADGAPGLAGTKGLDGAQGRDGRDGSPGRDAAQVDILPAINEERSYARGTWASHKGGIWCAKRATEGMEGWECLHVGLADIQQEVGDDGRTITTKHILSDGRVIAHTRKTVDVIYRGVFKDGGQYERGDTTTWGGSTWHCNESTADKPIEGGKAWTLMTKRGRDGKDGPPGKQGEKGLDGRAGRDLTQMLADGRKF